MTENLKRNFKKYEKISICRVYLENKYWRTKLADSIIIRKIPKEFLGLSLLELWANLK